MVAADETDRIPTSQQTPTPRKDDLSYEEVDGAARPRRRWLRYVALLVLFSIGAGAAWFSHKAGWFGTKGGAIPIVHANKDPVKTKPTDPGGRDVPDRDKLVYDRLAPDSAKPEAERLLPRAEAPIPPPKSSMKPQIAPEEMTGLKDPPPVPEKRPAPQPETKAETKSERLAPPPAPQGASKMPEKPETKKAEPPKDVEALIARTVDKPKAESKTPPESATPEKTYRVQLAAVRERARAEKEWERIKGKHADVLGALKLSVMRADLGAKGVFYRLRAGPLDSEDAARALCEKLAARKVPCLVVRPNG